MIGATLAIPVAFIMLAALVCWLVIGTRGKWSYKLPVMVLVPALGLAVWAAIGSYQGWPTPERMPDKVLLKWYDVHTPQKATGDPGVIYIWAVPLTQTDKPGILEYRYPQGAPRAYEMPYSRQLHETLHGVLGKLQHGRPVLLQRSHPSGPHRGHPGHGNRRGGSSGHHSEYKAYDLPSAPPPRKNGR